MASRYIGMVVGERTKRVYSVINPETDEELDKPNHLEITVEEPETLHMVKVERSGHERFGSFEDLASIITDYYVRTHYRPDEPPPDGDERIDFMS
jgi:hypothetical protein